MIGGNGMKKKEFAVLGLGRFGRSLALALSESGCEVMVADNNPGSVSEVSESVVHAEIGDVTSKEFLASLGLSNYDAVVVGIGGDLEACVMATMLAKEVGAKFVISKAGSELQSRILKKIGADRVIFPEYETGLRLAMQLSQGHFYDMREISMTHSIAEIDMPEHWIGKTLKELNLRSKYSINIIAIKRGEEIIVTPNPDAPMLADDTLVMLGENTMIEKLIDKNKDQRSDDKA